MIPAVSRGAFNIGPIGQIGPIFFRCPRAGPHRLRSAPSVRPCLFELYSSFKPTLPCFFLTSGQAKAGAVAAAGGNVPVAISGSDKPAVDEPTAAA